MKNFETITLTNGLTILNFNSPHSFAFGDGKVLNSVSMEVAKETMLSNEDIETFNGKFTTVKKIFTMSQACKDRLVEVQNLPNVDVILVPLPVLLLANELGLNKGKLHTGFIVDRINKILSTDKFCQ